ncbi:hypothetical protein [Candidatus Reidiella endopervernicosa]|uniref:hypothetical protein n=1 Tax=Candidatus Reidiella endopervernicosa TaxID=2738883 RepID=UPI003B969690
MAIRVLMPQCRWKEKTGDKTVTSCAVGPFRWVTASAISADGNLVVTGGADGVVSINEASSGRVIRRISAHPGNLGKINVLQLAFDDSVVITGSDDGQSVYGRSKREESACRLM